MNKLKLKQQLEQFFVEDIGDRDVSSTIFHEKQAGQIDFVAKADGIFCGEEIIHTGFSMLVDNVEIEMHVHDGESVTKQQILATISGNVAQLLQSERVILNLIQRMSGIATQTQAAVSILNSQHTKICDTRKTTPGLRMLEKYAVRCGGGVNHRYGLYDAVMLKDNHIAFAGSITKAVEAVRQRVGHMVKIEVEIETKAQMLEAIEAQADVIMFDNRQPEEIKMWIQEVPDTIVTEASGGITLERLADYREAGVDYISLGFLTHSISSLDISAKVTIE
ncbi:carboxylating nicotinate-nucleotide diphosphorylase [Gracilibacillus alcaliphilus]|uniref:carboxylating nicotinate-nucleotide diphosphorylase n=1 Tax=Gracilibacillus alcaliphilus TaxID=1401441 RepID=UPI0019599F49|nr:carboxylating nicotinate-nucleotide diphosphorylase [Gracilibacillus alcaliphilus]MBM7676764.1 nicotinate-nucleotide pyrophosphorylase (carboxylating) [Gracilibacillus alcaliphilus]